MLLAAALVPETALLVPGAAGRADVLADVRDAALEAVSAVLATGPGRVVVVAPGPAPRELAPPVRASLGAAGVPDSVLGWAAPGVTPHAETAGVGASVGLLLLARAGATVPVSVVEVAAAQDAATLRAAGARLAAAGDLGLVVLGSLSARHGPDAVLADDDRAPGLDQSLVELVVRAGTDADARADLGDVEPGLAAELAVTAWAPWQVLLGAAAEEPFDARVLASATPLGASLLVASWTRATPAAEGAA